MSADVKRTTGIHLIKALCMIGMPLINLIEYMYYYDAFSFDTNALMVLSAIGPGAFLICMGYELGTGASPKQLSKMGVQLILIGLILNLIRYGIPHLPIHFVVPAEMPWSRYFAHLIESDLYYAVGLFYLLMALFKKMKLSDFYCLLASLVMLSANTVITKLIHVPESARFFSCCVGNFIYLNQHSIFPILSWCVFPIVGIYLAKGFKNSWKDNQKILKLFAGSIVGLIALYTSLWYFDLDLYAISLSQANTWIVELFNVMIQIGLALQAIAVLQLIINVTPVNAVENYLYKISFYLMPYYFISWVLIAWFGAILGGIFWLTYSIPLYAVLALAVFIIVVSLILSERYGLKLMRFLMKITGGKRKRKKITAK